VTPSRHFLNVNVLFARHNTRRVPGTKFSDDDCTAVTEEERRRPMDVIAAMFAYLGCVTGIVGALAISLFVFFSAPRQQIAPKYTVAIAAKSDKLNTTFATDTKPAFATDTKPASTSTAAKAETTPAPKFAANIRPRTQTPSEQLRRLVQQERARRFAYQQDPAFEARFLGYAD
jgi:hypothetical protein